MQQIWGLKVLVCRLVGRFSCALCFHILFTRDVQGFRYFGKLGSLRCLALPPKRGHNLFHGCSEYLALLLKSWDCHRPCLAPDHALAAMPPTPNCLGGPRPSADRALVVVPCRQPCPSHGHGRSPMDESDVPQTHRTARRRVERPETNRMEQTNRQKDPSISRAK